LAKKRGLKIGNNFSGFLTERHYREQRCMAHLSKNAVPNLAQISPVRRFLAYDVLVICLFTFYLSINSMIHSFVFHLYFVEIRNRHNI